MGDAAADAAADEYGERSIIIMDADNRDKLWRVMAELGRARDRFFIHYSGAGRDVDLRDELLVMEAAAKRALALLDVPCTMYDVRFGSSAAEPRDEKGGKNNG